MKTKLVSWSVMAATLLAIALVPVSALPRSAIAYNVERVPAASDAVERGDTRGQVLRQLGAPDRKLGRDVWIYHGYHPRSVQANRDGCDTLVVKLDGGRVRDLKLVNGTAFEIYSQAVQAGKGVRFEPAPALATATE